jgi:hypothetical protein
MVSKDEISLCAAYLSGMPDTSPLPHLQPILLHKFMVEICLFIA